MRLRFIRPWDWNSIALGTRTHCIGVILGNSDEDHAAWETMKRWCEDNIGPENTAWVSSTSHRFEFINPNHLFLFRLRFEHSDG